MAPILDKFKKVGLVLACTLDLKSIKKERRLWAKRWLQHRKKFSHVALLRELECDDFRNYLRMDENCFTELLILVSLLIEKQDTVMRESVSSEERLLATLRFLATGREYEDLKFSTAISPQLLSSIIPETCQAIFSVLKNYIQRTAERALMEYFVDKLYHFMNFQINDKAEDAMYQDFLFLLKISGCFLDLTREKFLLSFCHILFFICIIVFDSYCLFITILKFIDSSYILFLQSLHFFLLLVLTVVFLLDLNTKRNILVNFFKLVGDNFYDYGEKNSEKLTNKLKLNMKKERYRMLVLPIMVIFIGISFVTLPQLLDDNRLTNEDINFNLPIPAYAPFDSRHGFKFYFAFTLELFLVVIFMLTIGSGAFLLIVMEQHVDLQLSILIESVNTIEKRAVNRYVKLFNVNPPKKELEMYGDNSFQLCSQFCLEQNIKHHQIILSAARDVGRVISIPIFFACSIGMIVIALSLFVITKEKKLIGTLICTVELCVGEIVAIFLLTFFGQRLIDQSSRLRQDVYNIKWYHCSMPIRRDVMILQEASLTPITLKAGGMIPLNMDYFASVMNSAYSYFNMVNVFGKIQ